MTPQELSRLDYEGASEMLIAYATDAKKYEREIASLKAQTNDWKAKATLAQTKNMPDLAQAALRRATEFDTKSRELELELSGIRRDIEDLRSALPLLKAKQRRVDPDQLLAELSMIVGSESTQFDTELAQGESAHPQDCSVGNLEGSPVAGSPSGTQYRGEMSGDTSSQSGRAEPAQSEAPSSPDSDTREKAGGKASPGPSSPSSASPAHASSADDALAELKRKMGLL